MSSNATMQPLPRSGLGCLSQYGDNRKAAAFNPEWRRTDGFGLSMAALLTSPLNCPS